VIDTDTLFVKCPHYARPMAACLPKPNSAHGETQCRHQEGGRLGRPGGVQRLSGNPAYPAHPNAR
jgi:hypothetical protein